jgi:predicted nucleotidyltransferase
MALRDNKESIELIAKRYTELVKNNININGAYLFGSYVKGTYSEDSDIDIAIIGDEFSGDCIEDTFKLMKLRRKIDNRIEPHPFNNKDFDISDPFVREIIKNGIKII